MNNIKLNWQCKPFNELTAAELYQILQLRSRVFIIEQQCNYLDEDGKDYKSHHLMAWDNDCLAAYARLIPAAIAYPEASIGRVITSSKYRATGIGKKLMAKSINEVYKHFGKQPIRIGAQLYLKRFYENFGFVTCSDEYMEDNILHIEMLKS